MRIIRLLIGVFLENGYSSDDKREDLHKIFIAKLVFAQLNPAYTSATSHKRALIKTIINNETLSLFTPKTSLFKIQNWNFLLCMSERYKMKASIIYEFGLRAPERDRDIDFKRTE